MMKKGVAASVTDDQYDEDLTDDQYYKNLLEAIRSSDVERVKKLLKLKELPSGSKLEDLVNRTNSEGFAPLHIAVRQFDKKIVDILLEESAVDINKKDIKKQDVEDETPLYVEDETPLFAAAFLGCTEIVRALLNKHNIDVNKANLFGATPLYIASHEGHGEIVKLLVEKDGVDLNQRTTDEKRQAYYKNASPLFAAVGEGHAETVRMLVNAHVELNTTMNGETPLHVAAIEGYHDIVQLLVEAGVDPNEKSHKGKRNEETALFAAACQGHTKVVEVLVKAEGIDLHERSHNMKSPLHIAVLQFFENKEAQEATSEQLCQKYENIVRVLLGAQGFNISRECTKSKESLLDFASMVQLGSPIIEELKKKLSGNKGKTDAAVRKHNFFKKKKARVAASSLLNPIKTDTYTGAGKKMPRELLKAFSEKNKKTLNSILGDVEFIFSRHYTQFFNQSSLPGARHSSPTKQQLKYLSTIKSHCEFFGSGEDLSNMYIFMECESVLRDLQAASDAAMKDFKSTGTETKLHTEPQKYIGLFSNRWERHKSLLYTELQKYINLFSGIWKRHKSLSEGCTLDAIFEEENKKAFPGSDTSKVLS